MSSDKVLLGILAGAAIGAAMGILFAPDKGSETRRKISEKSDAYADALRSKFNELVDEIVQQFDSLREDALQNDENVKHSGLEAELKTAAKQKS